MATDYRIPARMRQLEEWLRTSFATPYPVRVQWVKMVKADSDEPTYVKKRGYFGECFYEGGTIVIQLSKTLCSRNRQAAYDTLQHEWAHAMTMPNERLYRTAKNLKPHPDEFWLAYGRIYRAWIDEGGADDSLLL